VTYIFIPSAGIQGVNQNAYWMLFSVNGSFHSTC